MIESFFKLHPIDVATVETYKLLALTDLSDSCKPLKSFEEMRLSPSFVETVKLTNFQLLEQKFENSFQHHYLSEVALLKMKQPFEYELDELTDIKDVMKICLNYIIENKLSTLYRNFVMGEELLATKIPE